LIKAALLETIARFLPSNMALFSKKRLKYSFWGLIVPVLSIAYLWCIFCDNYFNNFCNMRFMDIVFILERTKIKFFHIRLKYNHFILYLGIF
jgi:hypothetical protein